MSRVVRIGLAQVPSEPGAVNENWLRGQAAIKRAASLGAQLIVFPELFLQSYRADADTAATAQTVDSPWARELKQLAQHLRVVVVMGFARADTEVPHLVYNSALIAGPDGLVGWYDKVHLGTYLDYKEGVYFASGQGLPVFDTPIGRIGVEICYDISYPETARVLALNGAELHVVLGAGPTEFRDTWGPLLQVRSRENGFFSVFVNTVGDQRGQWFFGGSRVVGPDGTERFSCQEDVPDLAVGDIDLDEVVIRRRQTLLFRDRKPALYQPISETR